MAAQAGKACVHFGSKDAGGGAGMGVAGPDPGLGVAGGQFLGNGDGFGDHCAIGRAHGGRGLGGEIAFQQIWQFIGVKPGGVGFHRNPESIEQKPAAQAPRGIGAVADHKVIGHVCCPFAAIEPWPHSKGKR